MKNKNTLIAVAVLLVILIGIIIWKSSDTVPSDTLASDLSTSTVLARLSSATWVWTGTLLNNGSTTEPRKTDAFTVTFEGEGRVIGTTDCNSFFGEYSVAPGGVISFGPLASTKMYCEGSQEAVFTKHVSDSNGVHFTEAGDLVLLLPYDSGSVTFRQMATPAAVSSSKNASDEPIGFANLSYRLIGYKNISIPTDKNYTLTFSGANGISAKFCNSMSGTYSESKGTIMAPQLISTLMFCEEPDNLMGLESAFAAALAEGVTVSVQGNYLALTDSKWNRFTFELVR